MILSGKTYSKRHDLYLARDFWECHNGEGIGPKNSPNINYARRDRLGDGLIGLRQECHWVRTENTPLEC